MPVQKLAVLKCSSVSWASKLPLRQLLVQSPASDLQQTKMFPTVEQWSRLQVQNINVPNTLRFVLETAALQCAQVLVHTKAAYAQITPIEKSTVNAL